MTDAPLNEVIEIRFVGGDIAPRNVRAGDLAELLEAVELLVQSNVLREHDELTPDDFFLALGEVHEGSLALQFTSPIPQVVVPTFEKVADLVQTERFDLLPAPANEALRRIALFNRKNRCVAEFRAGGGEAVLATVASNLVIPPAPRLDMRTTLYGWVQEAGGKRPNVHIETIQGQRIVCAGSRAQVKQLAERLYDMVGIVGTARVDAATDGIIEFVIDDILPYTAIPIDAAMRELRDATGQGFDGVDADAYVRALREDVSEV